MPTEFSPDFLAAPQKRLELFFLGSPHASLPGGQDVRFTVDNSLLLLAYLISNPHKIIRRDELAARLYPDHSEKEASVNLRQILLRLRRAIGDDAANPPYILSTQLNLQFNPESHYWLDVQEFESGLSAVLNHRHRRLQVCRECMAQLDQAIHLYHGDFLGGIENAHFADWLQITRYDLHRKISWALQNLAGFAFQRQQYTESQAYLNRLVKIDTLNEYALRLEMQILAFQGQRNRALQRYQEFKRKLLNELEISPEPETIQLAQKIQSTQPFSSFHTNRQRKDTLLTLQDFSATALPNTLIPFISRQPELAQITKCLSGLDCRLITLVGPGGIGKTRLAMRAAADDTPAWNDGVWLVLLADAQGSHGLENAIVKALGIPVNPSVPRHNQIHNFLREKEMLLVLDNFEQVIEQAGFVKALLDHAPRLKVIATSRQRLGIRGEQLIDVQGLDFPPPGECHPSSQADWVNLPACFGAIQLFVENARRIRPEFTFDLENVDAIVQICQQLDGLPLGIELASSWVKVLPCDEILKRIKRDADFLTTQDRDVPTRQASLRAVFEYSWKLLSVEERRAIGKVLTLPDGFTSAMLADQPDFDLRILASLRNKSILHEFSDGRLGLAPGTRTYITEKITQEIK